MFKIKPYARVVWFYIFLVVAVPAVAMHFLHLELTSPITMVSAALAFAAGAVELCRSPAQ